MEISEKRKRIINLNTMIGFFAALRMTLNGEFIVVEGNLFLCHFLAKGCLRQWAARHFGIDAIKSGKPPRRKLNLFNSMVYGVVRELYYRTYSSRQFHCRT
jgi:hypothetical protein